MPDEVMQIAGRIKDIREATGLTPQEVANTIGTVSYTHLDVYKRQEPTDRGASSRRRNCLYSILYPQKIFNPNSGKIPRA